jgi:hypothetical protein
MRSFITFTLRYIYMYNRMIKSRRMRLAGNIASVGLKRNAYRILVGEPVGKTSIESPTHRLEDIIKMDLGEIGWDGMDWIRLRIGTSGGLL